MFAERSGIAAIPANRLLTATLVTGAWTLFGLSFAIQRYIERAYTSNPTSLARALIAWAACAYIWAALTPIVAWLIRRFPISRHDTLRMLPLHLMLGTGVAILHLVIYLQALELLMPARPGTFASFEMLQSMIVADLHFNLVLYGLIAAATVYLDKRRVERRLRQHCSDLEERLDEVTNLSPETPAYVERLAVKIRNGTVFLNTSDISWIKADDNYLHINCAGTTYIHRQSLRSLEADLDPKKFVRIRRSTIVSVDRVRELLPVYNREFVLVLDDGTRVQSSRRYRSNLDPLLGPRRPLAAHSATACHK
jgi:two-component system LytT family response regulator